MARPVFCVVALTFALTSCFATTFTQINPGAALVFVLNKMDLLVSVPEIEGEARKLAARWHAPCYLSSAHTGEAVEAAFRALAAALLT